MSYSIELNKVSKFYQLGKDIISNVDLKVDNSNIIGLRGANGSGKSTLLKILAGVSKASKGDVKYFIDNNLVKYSYFAPYMAMIAPYVNIYEEFTPKQLFNKIQIIKCQNYDIDFMIELSQQLSIEKWLDKPILQFSSGMKQKVKIISMLIFRPKLLILDEFASNLDNQSIDTINNILLYCKNQGVSIIIAGNDDRELSICEKNYKIESGRLLDF